MRKGFVLIILFTLAVGIFVLGIPSTRNSNRPLIEQIAAMRQIGLKLSQYEHPATEGDDLKTKSIDDFVSMNVLTPADALYLRDRQVTFYGYDPSRIGGDIPLFEAPYSYGGYQARIVCYSDISIVTLAARKD